MLCTLGIAKVVGVRQSERLQSSGTDRVELRVDRHHQRCFTVN
jgi:hypothetical protein